MNLGKKCAFRRRGSCQAGAKARKLSSRPEGRMSPLDSSQNVMKKCSNPEHPHCTFWVLPGDTVCAGNHPQATTAPSSYDLLTALRSARSEPSATALSHAPAHDSDIRDAATQTVSRSSPAAAAPAFTPAPVAPATVPPAYQPVQAHLHISGFDPSAAGGRQTMKMEMRGMGAACAQKQTLRL